MKVKVTLVVFEHPNPTEWDRYCSYCPELWDFFGRGDTIQQCIDWVQTNLEEELQNRNKYRNLKIRNWVYDNNCAIPPIFTHDEAVKLTEKSYEIDIPEYQIFELYAEVPILPS